MSDKDKLEISHKDKNEIFSDYCNLHLKIFNNLPSKSNLLQSLFLKKISFPYDPIKKSVGHIRLKL